MCATALGWPSGAQTWTSWVARGETRRGRGRFLSNPTEPEGICQNTNKQKQTKNLDKLLSTFRCIWMLLSNIRICVFSRAERSELVRRERGELNCLLTL